MTCVLPALENRVWGSSVQYSPPFKQRSAVHCRVLLHSFLVRLGKIGHGKPRCQSATRDGSGSGNVLTASASNPSVFFTRAQSTEVDNFSFDLVSDDLPVLEGGCAQDKERNVTSISCTSSVRQFVVAAQ